MLQGAELVPMTSEQIMEKPKEISSSIGIEIGSITESSSSQLIKVRHSLVRLVDC